MNWSISGAWNAAVSGESKKIEPRDYLYASELGGALIDIIMKLRGVQPTNPPNDRARRKFFAGNVFEDILYLALLRCGIVKDTQVHCRHQYDGLLMVSGRCDFLVGGLIDSEKSIAEIKAMKLSEHMESVSISVVEKLYEIYQNVELEEHLLECKSVSDHMFEKIEAQNQPQTHHLLQAYHYKKSLNLPAKIIYINRDDCRVIEFVVNDCEEDYLNEVKKITMAYRNEVEVKPEPEILFENGKFSKNWRVEYSNYLTLLYGYKSPFEYYEKWERTIARWNRVMGRVKTGKKMTADNQSAIEEIRKHFQNIDEIIEKFQSNEEEV